MDFVTGTHGTALSTIINYYDSTYRFADFMAMVNIMPWVVSMSCLGNLFKKNNSKSSLKQYY